VSHTVIRTDSIINTGRFVLCTDVHIELYFSGAASHIIQHPRLARHLLEKKVTFFGFYFLPSTLLPKIAWRVCYFLEKYHFLRNVVCFLNVDLFIIVVTRAIIQCF
jgi:hypothetical protein